MKYMLTPSLPAASFEEIKTLSRQLEGTASLLQIDMVDGKFATPPSWPFTESDPKAALSKLDDLKSIAIEADCMFNNPMQYLPDLVAHGVSRIIIHIGSTQEYSHIIAHAHSHAYELGFAITNDVPASFLYPYIEHIDFVQVMGIEKIGKQGQDFDPQALTTIKKIRTKFPELDIAVDGSVNVETLPLLQQAGANRFAPGSAVTQAENPAVAYAQLQDLMNKNIVR